MTAAAPFALPPLPPTRPGSRADGLSPLQRRTMVALIVALHGAGAYALLQVRQVREAVADAAPMFVRLVTPEAPPTPVVPPPPPPVAKPRNVPPAPKPLLRAPPAPSPAPAAFTAPPEPPPLPVAVEPPPAPPAPPAPPPPPRMLPPSAVQYLEPPVPVYPRASRRAGESGRVVLRVFIDEAGLPRELQVQASSGFARLDEAAAAAVAKARFKPYSDGGRPMAGWALVPLSFDLEK